MGLGLLMIAIGTSLVGLGGLGYLFYQELLSGAKREVEQSNTAQTRKIETNLSNVRQSTNAVASAAKVLVQQPAKPRNADPYQRLLAEAVQGNQAIAGMGISQNAIALFPTPRVTVPYVWRSAAGLTPEVAGRKLAAPYDQFLTSSRPEIVNSNYYKTTIKGQEFWSEPYNALGQSLITYSAPIKDGQRILGVVNADAIAKDLLALQDIASGDSAKKIGFVILNSSGKVITASEQFQVTQSQNSTIAEAVQEITQQAKAQPTGIAQVGGNLWSYRKIEGSDWIVATYLPESEIINKLMIFVGGAALGISAILAIAILGFINTLKKRLQPITEECNQFLAQHSNVNSTNIGKDEIESLSISIKNTLQRAKVDESRYRNEMKPAIDVDPESTSTQSTQATQANNAETDLMEAEVGDLLDVVSSMEEGDLTIEAQVNDRATGLVADTLNRLREKLIEIISSVLGTAQQVAKGAADLEELAKTVVLNTAEQAESVAQGQALTEQVAAIAQRSADQINVANQSLQEVRDTVSSGQTAINTLTDSISVLQTGSAQIVQRMKTLGEFVGLAEQFVQNQGQIASLTQVLALNATLVAARAAEQKDPKQFAGVAREFESIAAQVNDLATQTNDGLTVLQQRTSQIQTVVTAIDAEVQNLSGLVSGFTAGVDESQSAFNSIQMATAEVVQIGEAITVSSTEIAEAAGSTASYISEIAQLADRTANLTRSARQQAEAMGNQAQRLLQGIQFFRLPESAIASPENFAATGINTGVETDYDTAGLPLGLSEEPELTAGTAIDGYTDSYAEDSNLNLGLGLAAAVPLTAAVASQIGQEQFTDDSDADYLTDQDSQFEQIERIEQFAQTEQFEQTEQIDQYAQVTQKDQFEFASPEQFTDEAIADSSLEPAELSDISLIEQSLFDDLRQEIYDESLQTSDLDTSDFDNISSEILEDSDAEATDSVFEFDFNANADDEINDLKNPLEGVNESAIVDPASDPLIASASAAFVEDTVFGTPSPLSEEALANVPQFVDFTIPELDDDDDFHIPNTPIESALDNSNSFYVPDLSIAESDDLALNDIDPFASDFTTDAVAIDANQNYESYEDYASYENVYENVEDENIFESNYLVDAPVGNDADNVFGSNYQEDLGVFASENNVLEIDESDDYANFGEEIIATDFSEELEDAIPDLDLSEAIAEDISETASEDLDNVFSESMLSELDDLPKAADNYNYLGDNQVLEQLETTANDQFSNQLDGQLDEQFDDQFAGQFSEALTDDVDAFGFAAAESTSLADESAFDLVLSDPDELNDELNEASVDDFDYLDYQNQQNELQDESQNPAFNQFDYLDEQVNNLNELNEQILDQDNALNPLDDQFAYIDDAAIPSSSIPNDVFSNDEDLDDLSKYSNSDELSNTFADAYDESSFEQAINDTNYNYGVVTEAEELTNDLPQPQEENVSVFDLDLDNAIADDEFLDEDDYEPIALNLEQEIQEDVSAFTGIPDRYLDDSVDETDETLDDDLEFNFDLGEEEQEAIAISGLGENADMGDTAEVSELFNLDANTELEDADPFAIAEASNLELDNLETSDFDDFSFITDDLIPDSTQPSDSSDFSESLESLETLESLEPLESLENFESLESFSSTDSLNLPSESSQDMTSSNSFNSFNSFDEVLDASENLEEIEGLENLDTLENFAGITELTELSDIQYASPSQDVPMEDVDISALFAIADEDEDLQPDIAEDIPVDVSMEAMESTDFVDFSLPEDSSDSAFSYPLATDTDALSTETPNADPFNAGASDVDLSAVDLSEVGFDDDFGADLDNYSEIPSETDIDDFPEAVSLKESEISEISEMMDILESPELSTGISAIEAVELAESTEVMEPVSIFGDDENDSWLEDLEPSDDAISDTIANSIDIPIDIPVDLNDGGQPSYEFANSLLDSLIEETGADSFDEGFDEGFSEDVNADISAIAAMDLDSEFEPELVTNMPDFGDLGISEPIGEPPSDVNFFDFDNTLSPSPVAETLEDSGDLDEDAIFDFDFSEIGSELSSDISNSDTDESLQENALQENALQEPITQIFNQPIVPPPTAPNIPKDVINSAKSEIDDFLAGTLDIDEVSNSISPQSDS